MAAGKARRGGALARAEATLDETIAIAKACPSLRYDSALEIRPISEECPLEACARRKAKAEQLAAATV